MKLKKLNISTNSLLVVFGFVCLVFIIGGWFYWFEWRPTEIRKLCLGEVGKEKADRENLTVSAANKQYQVCLVKHGMKPEPFVLER